MWPLTFTVSVRSQLYLVPLSCNCNCNLPRQPTPKTISTVSMAAWFSAGHTTQANSDKACKDRVRLVVLVDLFFSSATLTEVFPYFFLSFKANARVKLAKTGHGPHSSKLVICVFPLLFVLFYVLFVCKCVLYCTVLLPPGVNPIAVNKYIISQHIICLHRRVCGFRVCKSVHHHTFNWINKQDAATSRVYYLSFRYSSTCFGHPHAHHQELQQLQ